ncbi:pyrimidine dimer DNA glycosylase/endonuclease V [bacterium]|nr:pyrimidine dimer DNA glycosylase/endonuclease V [bacterium]
MRIWSIHPKYLDAKGLVALWRETLLAQKVLDGKTKGYKNHPQLERFKATKDPLASVGTYLLHVVEEAERRSYRFDKTKILKTSSRLIIKVTKMQLEYETQHLLMKLKKRDPKRFAELSEKKTLPPHPIFKSVAGPVESWERFDK